MNVVQPFCVWHSYALPSVVTRQIDRNCRMGEKIYSFLICFNIFGFAASHPKYKTEKKRENDEVKEKSRNKSKIILNGMNRIIE